MLSLNEWDAWACLVQLFGMFGKLWQIVLQESKEKSKEPSELAQTADTNKRGGGVAQRTELDVLDVSSVAGV